MRFIAVLMFAGFAAHGAWAKSPGFIRRESSVDRVACKSANGVTTIFIEIRSSTTIKCDWQRKGQDMSAKGSCVTRINLAKKAGAVCQKYLTVARKPAIYLYPKKPMQVDVKLSFHGKLTVTYPDYDSAKGGWTVKAFPDGQLINAADGKTYSYIFWEGTPSEGASYDLSTGFVVAAADTKSFLQKTLPELGLIPKEYSEFIVYWLPILQKNPYNLIHFAGADYEKTAPLQVTPKPDSVLRVFMVYMPLKLPIQVKPQAIVSFKRTGFSVVEWGGLGLN